MKTKLEIKVNIPKQNQKQQIRQCVSYLVQHKVRTNEYMTVMVANREVLFFDDNCVSFGSVEYLADTYTIIRELTQDESVTFYGNSK